MLRASLIEISYFIKKWGKVKIERKRVKAVCLGSTIDGCYFSCVCIGALIC